MSGAATTPDNGAPIPQFSQNLGHPAPLWMLFMSEFWERFAFYGIRWALVLYIVAQFHGGDSSGQAPANLTYGSYLALVYAVAIFGGYIADKVLGLDALAPANRLRLRRSMAAVLSQPYLTDESVFDCVALPLRLRGQRDAGAVEANAEMSGRR